MRLAGLAAGLGLGLVAAVAACGEGKVNQRADAFVQRPTIDPAPYYIDCVMSDPLACPDPYECTVPDLAHDPTGDVCLVPCTIDADCAVGYFCNGAEQQAETGASNHCAADV